MPGAENISGAFVSFSTVLCLHQASCSPSFQPWSPQSTTMVFFAEAEAVQFVEHPADLGVHVADRGVVAVLELPREVVRDGAAGMPW